MTWNPTVPGGAATPRPRVAYAYASGVATLTIDRAEKSNALDEAFFRELNALVSRIHGDDTVRCVVVTGTGRAFSAGADVAELDGLAGHAAYEFAATGQFVFDQLENLPKPVI
ncbi:MAG TPA: enoyl-CoA hydratase/isomerase family protein, partial [Microbacteriaceae bacterium]|nr:enoyl-CoA hydratase/isomerase family protein [Microbacteriaceae bacterium]